MKEWFESWFDTRYYHVLYKNRDHSEAELFIQNLFDKIQLDLDKRVLDLACGKGRHAIYANSLGYNTTGVDLSAESIKTAQESQKEGLSFFQHDMRLPIPNQRFDLVMNLFTSFGYFNCKEDNELMLRSVYGYLNDGGKLVIDFFNAPYVEKQMVPREVKEIDGLKFEIQKSIHEGFIVKDIRFSDQGKDYHFQEKVQLLTRTDFELFLSQANFEIESIYGNYQFGDLTEDSDRLIIIAKKMSA